MIHGGICLAGRAGSGKSPLAKNIVGVLQAEGHAARKLSFADAIKQEVWELYGIKKEDEGGRERLIAHGNERIQLDPTYWVRRLMSDVQTCWMQDVIPVVDDVRREPEYARLSYESFYRVKVMAPETFRRAALKRAGLDPDFATSDDPTERNHEAWLFDFTRVLMHTGRDFASAACQIVDHCLDYDWFSPVVARVSRSEAR